MEVQLRAGTQVTPTSTVAISNCRCDVHVTRYLAAILVHHARFLPSPKVHVTWRLTHHALTFWVHLSGLQSGNKRINEWTKFSNVFIYYCRLFLKTCLLNVVKGSSIFVNDFDVLLHMSTTEWETELQRGFASEGVHGESIYWSWRPRSRTPVYHHTGVTIHFNPRYNLLLAAPRAGH